MEYLAFDNIDRLEELSQEEAPSTGGMFPIVYNNNQRLVKVEDQTLTVFICYSDD